MHVTLFISKAHIQHNEMHKLMSLNAVQLKSTLFGVILGITSFGVESTLKL